MDFYQLEADDGIRCVWNNLPPTKLAATRAVLPPAIHYTPFKDLENMPKVNYDPLRCRCSAILNPYCQVDYRNKIWMCPFCMSRNPFTQQYKEHISETNLPTELQQGNTTIEYELKPQNPSINQGIIPNVFLYLIDTCIEQEEMDALKEAIQDSLNYIPQDSYVGLITYGRYIFVHELGFQECPKSYAIKGDKTYTPQQIQEMLGLSVRNDPRGTATQETTKRFLLKLEDCQFGLNSIIDNIQIDPWVVGHQERQQRASGCALNVALAIMEASPFQGSRILSFIGGPATIGPGQVVDINYAATLRSYLDIQKENDLCKHIQKAKKYYQSLATRAIKVQSVVDFYAFSIDQVGLMEMRTLAEKTGGYTVMNEKFNSDVFLQTYKKIFDLDEETSELKMATSGKINMFVSKELKISGALGCCTSLKQTGPAVAEQEIGQGGTTSWYLGGIDRTTTATFMLDYNSANKEQNNSKTAYIQFHTSYKDPSGKMKLRVTSIAKKFADQTNFQELAYGFDQEAACVAMARYGIWKAEQEESLEVLKWLDRTLIRLVSKFGTYNANDPNSFRLSSTFSLYPQFMYHLRRSHFIQVFGASPDEISFYRVTLNRENVTNCLVMIQPALFQYTFDSDQPIPVNLDENAIDNKIILLLDTYFQVITWKGDHIKQWYDQNYQEQPEYESLKQLLENPLEDVKMIMEDRFPVPIFFETHKGHTKERYLKSRLNPSGNNMDVKESGHYITDDASLKLFMDHLIKLAVQSQN